jgi:hypothetical protein
LINLKKDQNKCPKKDQKKSQKEVQKRKIGQEILPKMILKKSKGKKHLSIRDARAQISRKINLSNNKMK